MTSRIKELMIMMSTFKGLVLNMLIMIRMRFACLLLCSVYLRFIYCIVMYYSNGYPIFVFICVCCLSFLAITV